MDFASYVHQYFKSGFLIYQNSGNVAKVCADNLKKPINKRWEKIICLCGLTENLFGSGNGNNFLSLFFQVAKDTGNSEMFSYTRNWLEKQNLLSAKDAHDYPAPELWYLIGVIFLFREIHFHENIREIWFDVKII